MRAFIRSAVRGFITLVILVAIVGFDLWRTTWASYGHAGKSTRITDLAVPVVVGFAVHALILHFIPSRKQLEKRKKRGQRKSGRSYAYAFGGKRK